NPTSAADFPGFPPHSRQRHLCAPVYPKIPCDKEQIFCDISPVSQRFRPVIPTVLLTGCAKPARALSKPVHNFTQITLTRWRARSAAQPPVQAVQNARRLSTPPCA